MIEAGSLDGVDVIYGVHLWTPIPVGTAASAAGPLMASTDEFFIEMQGLGGHGGMPHKTVDSVVAASALVLQLQSVVSRSVNPLDPAVVTIGSIQGGTAQNVIADRCKLAGTVRCFSEESRELIRERIHALAEGTAKAYGAKANITYMMGYPSLVNDEKETRRFFAEAPGVFGLRAEKSPPLCPPRILPITCRRFRAVLCSSVRGTLRRRPFTRIIIRSSILTKTPCSMRPVC